MCSLLRSKEYLGVTRRYLLYLLLYTIYRVLGSDTSLRLIVETE